MGTSGVLLLNTVLTVRAHQANSHRGDRMGGIHGCGDSCAGAAGTSDRIYSLGQTCTGEGEYDHESAAPGFEITTPQPALCIPRFLWQPCVQQDQYVSGESRSGAD